MFIKFLKPIISRNVNLSLAIGTSTDPVNDLPREDGEIKYFEGANPYVLSKSLFVKALAGQVLEISTYKYDESSNNLIFKLHHNCTKNKICTDYIDITTYEVAPISKEDFEIIEDSK